MEALLCSQALQPHSSQGQRSAADPVEASLWGTPQRACIQVLEVCGQYFCKGQGARRLDRFLAFLHRYSLAKASLPLDIDLDLQARPWLAQSRMPRQLHSWPHQHGLLCALPPAAAVRPRP